MELEPQINFWKLFDEPSLDEYISWHDDSTQSLKVGDGKQKNAAELFNGPCAPSFSQEVTVVPKPMKNNSSKANSCPVSSISCQKNPQICPSKDEHVHSLATVPYSTPVKYTIENSTAHSKLKIKLVLRPPRSQNAGSSPTLCLICGRNFHDQWVLNAHLTRMHAPMRNLRNTTANGSRKRKSAGGRRSGKNRSVAGSDDSCWVLQCGLCQMTFFQARDLHQHTITMHGAAKIIIKTPWLQARTTKKAKDSSSTAPNGPPQVFTSEIMSTQVSAVDTAENFDLTTETIVVGEGTTAERKSSVVNNGWKSSLSPSRTGQAGVTGTEALPGQPPNFSDVQKGPELRSSCSNPEIPEKASHSVTREATTGFISTTRRQDGDSLQDVTCESHLESDHHSGGSAERLGSAEPELREVPPREGSRKSAGGRRSGKNRSVAGSYNSFWVLQCGLCQMTFFRARDLHQHTITMHGAAKIIIKTPFLQARTTEKAKDSSSPAPTSQAKVITLDTMSTQASAVDTAENFDLTTDTIVAGEDDTTDRKSSLLNDNRKSSLSPSSTVQAGVTGTEALPVQPPNYTDVQKGPESRSSCSKPETPGKVPHSGVATTSVATTGSISPTRRQDGDRLQDVTCDSD